MKVTLALEQPLEFPLVEGLRKQVWLHAKELKKLNPELDIEIININSKNKKEYKKEGITIKNKGKLSFYRNKTNVLHYFGTPSPVLYLLLKFTRFRKFYITMTDGELGKFWESGWSMSSLKLIRKHALKIFLQTKYQKRIAQEYFSKEKIKIHPPLIPRIKKEGKKSKNPRLLFMSHLSEYKGVSEVLKAYKQLLKKHPDLELVIADSKLNEDENERVLKLIKRINEKGGNIILKGKVDPAKELSKSWIYLYPFKKAHNTFSVPISLYESLSCETPFISSDVGGLSEYFPKKLLLKKINSKSLVSKINSFLKNYDEFKKDFGDRKISNKEIMSGFAGEYKKPKCLFLYTKPHPVHKGFIESLKKDCYFDWISNKIYPHLNSILREKIMGRINVIRSFFRAFIYRNKYDFLVTENGYSLWMAFFIKVLSEEKPKWVYMSTDVLLYNYLNKEWKLKKLYRKILGTVDGFILVDGNLREKNKNKLNKQLGSPIEFAMPYLEREELFKLKNNSKINTNFLYVGRLVSAKNPIKTINILKQINKEKSVNLRIAGRGLLENKVKKNLENIEKFEFLGYVDDIKPLMKKSDFLLLLSDYEPFGVVVVEAMASGVIPIVSTRVGAKFLLEKECIINIDNSMGELVKDISKISSLDQNKLNEIRKIHKKKALECKKEKRLKEFRECFLELIQEI